MLSLFRRFSSATQIEQLNSAGVILGDGRDRTCRLLQRQGQMIDLVMLKDTAPKGAIVIVDLKNALAMEATVISARGNEVRVQVQSRHDLKGLVPSRLGRARDVWKRARA